MTIMITTKTAFAKRKQVPAPQNANLFHPCGRNRVSDDDALSQMRTYVRATGRPFRSSSGWSRL